MRYVGQNYELPVPLPDGPLDAASLDRLGRRLRRGAPPHVRLRRRGRADQLVTFRVEATGHGARRRSSRRSPIAAPTHPRRSSASREVWLPEAGGFVAAPVYDRERLGAGNRFAGPAIVEQMDATTLLLPGMIARVDPLLNLMLEAA